MDLQALKNQVAVEIGYESFDEYIRELIKAGSVYSVERLNKITDEICLRAQKEALKNAAENVTTVHHANQSSDEIERSIHYTKHSITNPENLIR